MQENKIGMSYSFSHSRTFLLYWLKQGWSLSQDKSLLTNLYCLWVNCRLPPYSRINPFSGLMGPNVLPILSWTAEVFIYLWLTSFCVCHTHASPRVASPCYWKSTKSRQWHFCAKLYCFVWPKRVACWRSNVARLISCTLDSLSVNRFPFWQPQFVRGGKDISGNSKLRREQFFPPTLVPLCFTCYRPPLIQKLLFSCFCFCFTALIIQLTREGVSPAHLHFWSILNVNSNWAFVIIFPCHFDFQLIAGRAGRIIKSCCMSRPCDLAHFDCNLLVIPPCGVCSSMVRWASVYFFDQSCWSSQAIFSSSLSEFRAGDLNIFRAPDPPTPSLPKRTFKKATQPFSNLLFASETFRSLTRRTGTRAPLQATNQYQIIPAMLFASYDKVLYPFIFSGVYLKEFECFIRLS